MLGIGLSTILVIFKIVGFVALGLFLICVLVNGVIWSIRWFSDNMGDSLQGHGKWFKDNMLKILLPSLRKDKK